MAAVFFEKSLASHVLTEVEGPVFVQGLAYPDTPSAEQYLPNWNEAFARIDTFGGLLQNEAGVDYDAEFDKLQADLEAIYNK